MKSNRTAIGARVYCRTAGRNQMQEVRSGGNYVSQSDLRLHFGLAAAKQCQLEVRWPTGQAEKFTNVAANRIIKIVEGKGIAAGEPVRR